MLSYSTFLPLTTYSFRIRTLIVGMEFTHLKALTAFFISKHHFLKGTSGALREGKKLQIDHDGLPRWCLLLTRVLCFLPPSSILFLHMSKIKRPLQKAGSGAGRRMKSYCIQFSLTLAVQ